MAVEGPAEGAAAPEETPDSVTGPEGTPEGGAGRAGVPKLTGRLFRLTLQPSHSRLSPRNLAGIVLVAALAWAALRRRDGDPVLRSLARASLAVSVAAVTASNLVVLSKMLSMFGSP